MASLLYGGGITGYAGVYCRAGDPHRRVAPRHLSSRAACRARLAAHGTAVRVSGRLHSYRIGTFLTYRASTGTGSLMLVMLAIMFPSPRGGRRRELRSGTSRADRSIPAPGRPFADHNLRDERVSSRVTVNPQNQKRQPKRTRNFLMPRASGGGHLTSRQGFRLLGQRLRGYQSANLPMLASVQP